MNRVFIILMLFSGAPFLLFAQEWSLDKYLQQGKISSPLLHDYINQTKVLRLDSAKLKAVYGLQMFAKGNFMYAPVIHGWGYDAAITNGQNLSAIMVLNKEIIAKKQLQARFTSLTIQEENVESQSKISEQSLARQITQQYILCYGDQQQIALCEATFSFLTKEDDILRKLTQSSVLKQTDYLAFKVDLLQQDLANQQIKAQQLNDFATLNYLCGIEDTSLHPLSEPSIHSNLTKSFDESDYAAGFRIDSLKNLNNAELANLNYKPRFSVFADGGYQSSLPGQAYKNLGVSAGVNITLPIYDGKQRKMSSLQNLLAEESRKRYREFVSRQYNQQKNQLVQQLDVYQKLISSAGQQIEYANTLVEANRKQLSTGDMPMTNYLLSVHNCLNLKASLIQYRTSELSVVNELNYLILK